MDAMAGVLEKLTTWLDASVRQREHGNRTVRIVGRVQMRFLLVQCQMATGSAAGFLSGKQGEGVFMPREAGHAALVVLAPGTCDIEDGTAERSVKPDGVVHRVRGRA